MLKDAKTLVEMQPANFASEDDFQRLLADFPSLLSGEHIDAAAPRRWVLVAREKAVPSEDGGSGRWSIDHLFLDQDGIPTLVEVKRHTDTRIRREVVGQMLDYAANGVAYWPVEEIRVLFEANCAASGIDTIEAITKLIGPDGDADDFWQRVKTNLQAGKIRMLFVADVIPPELRKIVEFLNRQMDPAEVLALELRQYEGEGLKTLVPILFGQTEEAQQKKAVGGAPRQWEEASIYAEMERRVGPEPVRIAKKLADWMRANADQVWHGHGSRNGSMGTTFVQHGVKLYPIQFSTNGRVTLNFGYCTKPPFDDEARRQEWLRRLNSVDGVNLPEDAIDRYPSIPMTILAGEPRLKGFLDAMDWFVAELRSSGKSSST